MRSIVECCKIRSWMGKVGEGVTQCFPQCESCTSSGIFQRQAQHKQKEVLLVYVLLCCGLPSCTSHGNLEEFKNSWQEGNALWGLSNVRECLWFRKILNHKLLETAEICQESIIVFALFLYLPQESGWICGLTPCTCCVLAIGIGQRQYLTALEMGYSSLFTNEERNVKHQEIY